MEGLPPLPPGFVLDTAAPPPPPPRIDPYKALKDEGFVFTNGYRTPADVERIRAQGYTPATNGAHNRGDGVDVDHPALSRVQQAARLNQIFKDGKGAKVLDEGHHRHVDLPGWGAAPGTPGTPNSGLPQLPEGFELQQRGPINPSNFVEPNQTAARIATIKQNGFEPVEEAKLVAAVQNELAQIVGSGTGVAFNDELPEQSATWTPEQEAEFVAFIADRRNNADAVRGYALSRGREVANADEIVAFRDKTGQVSDNVLQRVRPVAPNPDGALGAAGRGFADPLNVLDEMGAVVDTLGGTAGRESIWNSERGFGDILYNNIDQNRGVLAADERDHFGARFGGQLASGVLLPFGAGARGAAQLARYGAIEGGLAGFGAGEGNPLERTPNALAGAALGATGGYALGRVIDGVAPAVRSAFGRGTSTARDDALSVVREAARKSASDAPPVPPGFELAESVHGPVHRELANDYPAALARLRADQAGEVPGAIQHPEIGAVDLVWGDGRYGLSKIEKLHPEVVDDLPAIVTRLPVVQGPRETGNAVFVLSNDYHRAVVAEDFNGVEKRWLVTAYERKGAPGDQTSRRDPLSPDGGSTGGGAIEDINLSGASGNERTANVASFDETDNLGPKSILSFVPREGAPGIQVINEDGHLAIAVFRDANGAPKGAVQIPLSSEARDIYDNASVYVAPEFRRQGVATQLYDALRREGYPIDDLSGSGDLTPDGAAFVNRQRQAMASEVQDPTLVGRVDDLPPIPEGFVLDEPAIGRTRPMGERLSAEAVADLARGVNPEDVRPIPANWLESADELPTSLRTIEGPDSPGRAPKRPARFSETLKARLAADASQAGVPVRIDAEDAINNGVPAELIYHNPDVVDKTKLQLRNPSLFGTRYGRMSGNEQVLRSLDMDDVDPVEWGFDNLAGQRLGPEDIGDLLRRDLEGDPSALQRGGAYDAWTAHQERAAQRAEFADRYPNGAPVEQAGQTITLDDLNALQPPTSAYEDRPRFTGMVGNINLDRLESPEDVSRLIQQVQGKVGGFDEAKRGVVTNEETRALADELGLTPEQLLKRRRGQALNAEQLYATRVLVQKSREVVGRLAKEAVGGSDEQVAAFRNAWMRHVALEEQVTAATAEVGRAMQSFKMLAKAGDAKSEAVKAYLRGGGGRETVEEAAQKLVNMMEDPAAANTFLRNGAKVRKRDMLNEVWINSLLSGPRTHVVNFTSNALTSLYTLPEQVLTAGIGRVLGTPDRVMVTGVSRRAVGMIQGAREGLALARHALVTGEPLDSISKMEVNNYHAIPGKLGEVIRTPSRLLTASDEFWKAIIRNGHTHQEAYQRAMQGSGTPEQKMQRYRDLVLNPDGDLMKAADNAARYYTFQQPLGAGGRGIQQFVNNVPLAKLIVPFVRTPINILKFATERSVFAPGLKEVREAINAGGNRRNEAVARMTMGSGLSAWAVMAALDGKISAGPPSDSREAAALRNSGWQPYSIKIGDRWVSYQRFEPISLLAGVAADFATLGKYATADEADSIALGMSMAVAKNLTSKTWLSGLSDFMEVLSDSERYGERWVQRMVGSMTVPAVVAHAAGSMDPYLRETRTTLDGIKNRIPVLAEGLPVRRTVWGDPVKRGDAFGPDYISPVYATQVEGSPFLLEMARIRAPISMPSRSLRIDGKTVQLTPEQYDAYVQLSGQPARQYLEQQIRTPEWRSMDADTKREFLKETMTDFRASAREGLKERFPELQRGKLPPMPKGFEMPPLPPGFVLAK